MDKVEVILKNNKKGNVRKVRIHELWKLMIIQKKSFGIITMPLIQTLFEHITKKVHFRVVEQNNKLLGYIGIQQINITQSRINIIGVLPNKQHLGVGRALMRSAHEYPINDTTESIILNVRISNKYALDLYKSLGYHIVHIQEGYYNRPKEDGYYMQKNIT